MGFFKDIKEKLVGKSTKQNEKYVAGLDKSSSTFSDRINELAARFREINDEYFEELENILEENSDEPYADILAKNIYSFIRSGMEVETTGQLYKIIDKTLNFIEDKNRKDLVNKTAARVFQALRIEVNQEFEVLHEFVEKLHSIREKIEL